VPTELAVIGNSIIAVAYAAITFAIAVPLVRARQVVVNRLASATALIFLSCSVGHGFHAFAYLRSALDPSMPGMRLEDSWAWPSAVWDLFTATVAVYYWTLRRRYGALLRGGGGLYLDPHHRRRLEDAAAREHAATGRAERHRAMLAAIVEQSDDAIIGTSLDGKITAWNSGAERMFGRPAAEAFGRTPSELGAGSTPAQWQDRASRVAAGERDIRFEAHMTDARGELHEVSVTMSPVFDATGTVVAVAHVARDVTAAKRAEARQRTAEERAQQVQRMASLGQLAGGVAHDFNNLLGIILNFSDFAAEQVRADSAAHDDLTQIRTAAERAVGLTRQLLTFTRQDATNPAVLDVNAAIAEAKAMLERTIGEHINLVARPGAQPLPIYADAGHLQQVLINLAVNARDAMAEGGTLLIEAGAVDLEPGHAGVHPPLTGGRYVRLLVSDTGVGMSPEVVAKIFEPFFTTKPKGCGTGLGLATVYRIVAEAGGSIGVSSELDVGATFRVYFPLVDQPDDTAAPLTPAVATPRGRGETILVVEDEPALGRAVARILDGNGYRTRYAEDGEQALREHAEHGCELLLTDVIMPGLTGPQVAERLRSRHPGLPVIYMSGYTDGLLDSVPALEQDATFIQKPFTAQLLLSLVRERLQAGAPAAPRPPA
jgi:PAS domain S-box-containing protein